MHSDISFETLSEEFPDLQRADTVLQKEVYAHFGLVFYQFSVLEHALVNIVTISHLHAELKKGIIKREEDWTSEYDRTRLRLVGQTFGNLLRAVVAIPEFVDLEASFGRAKKNRDYFAHHLFREEIGYFFSEEGCKKLLVEFAKTRAAIDDLEAECEQRMAKLLTRLGIEIPTYEKRREAAFDLAVGAAAELAFGEAKFGWDP